MKKSEKIIAAVLTMVLGILLVIMRGNFIGILMTVAGLCLVVLGIADIIHRAVPPAVVKIIVGVFVIVCGWTAVGAVLYIVSAVLLIFGILLLYDKIKRGIRCRTLLNTVFEYAVPALCIAIGVLLLFHKASIVKVVFICTGVLTLITGGILLFNALSDE